VARKPQSRESENRARTGRQGRTSGKPSVGRQVSAFAFGPSDSRISQAGVGGYRNAIIAAGRKVANKFLPSEIGVHHSVTGVSGKPFTGSVKPSGTQGRTAMDQTPGNSYFWNTKGKGGAQKAASEANFQTKNIGDKWLLDPGQRASAQITRIPRGKSMQDVNLPGSAARTVVGGQKVIKSIASSAPTNPSGLTAFSQSDVKAIASAVKKAKAVEAAKSAAKISGVAGGAVAAKNKSRSGGKGRK